MNPASLSAAFGDIVLLLSFRLSGDRAAKFDRRHFYLGLLGTWGAGVGRYWDHPHAELAQRLGLGSLGYIVVMSALLWAVFRPVTGPRTEFWNFFTFVSLTSFPAWLYAIPVERFMSIDAATNVNIWFLAIVACWRVALLVRYARTVLGLTAWPVTVCSLLPLTAIIVLLATLNLEHAVFDVMGGLRQTTPGDGAYMVIIILSALSVVLAPLLLLFWLVLIIRQRRAFPAPRG